MSRPIPSRIRRTDPDGDEWWWRAFDSGAVRRTRNIWTDTEADSAWFASKTDALQTIHRVLDRLTDDEPGAVEIVPRG